MSAINYGGAICLCDGRAELALEKLEECQEKLNEKRAWVLQGRICSLIFDELTQMLDSEQVELLLKYEDVREELRKYRKCLSSLLCS